MKKVYYNIKKVSYIRNSCPIYEKGVKEVSYIRNRCPLKGVYILNTCPIYRCLKYKCVCVCTCVCGGLGLTCSKLSLLFSFRAVKFINMPRCACSTEVYGSVFVCLCVYRLLQLLKDESSASKSFYRLLAMFSWILICGFAK